MLSRLDLVHNVDITDVSAAALRGGLGSERRRAGMSQKEIEIILMRQLASYLAIPIFIVDPALTLLFYNSTFR